jgi:AraC family transcriptional regulator of adaptative response/methylated-DNA-[protein]-cysteine methyltransferase
MQAPLFGVDAGYESGSGFPEAFARAFGKAPARARGEGFLHADWIGTPLGPMVVIADENALHLLEFTDRERLQGQLDRLRSRTGSLVRPGSTPPIEAIRRELSDYFAGSRRAFDTATAPRGTDFEQSVWRELRRIPFGETRSYREVAAALGRRNGTRAVGRANGANPLAILIPCHRVLASDGSLCGYGGGLWRKRWLLEHERRRKIGRT